MLEEVSLLDPNLLAEMVWEDPDGEAYCQSLPESLNRLTCRLLQEEEFWIGVDAAGHRYGTINGSDTGGTYFDIHRQPHGTGDSEHIVRISKRVELVLGKPVKMYVTDRWEVDVTNGYLLIGLRGQCLTDDCVTENDTKEHVGVLRISGLPPLYDIVTTYEPSGLLSFTVPRHPEGLLAGDQFDMYSGAVSSLPDLAQAVPFACDVASGQGPGYRVRVLDTLPSPAAGQAAYFLTAATHAGQKRAGRMRTSGGLAGRNADLLPPCPES
jgi:hypothetical protein